jgi:stage II sporulation protein D
MMLALIMVAMLRSAEANTVRIGLFVLFNPYALEVKALDLGATLSAAGSDRTIKPGERVKIKRAAHSALEILTLDWGQQMIRVPEAIITPRGGGALELSLPGEMKRKFGGRILVGCKDGGGIKVILETDLESAVASIVAAEMSFCQKVEALKALAVLARTFISSNLGRHAREGFDFCDTTHCQFYRGMDGLSQLAIRAAAETRGQLLSFNGRLLEGYYTGACGGISAAPEQVWGNRPASRYPYGRIQCGWCRSRWERAANSDMVLAALSEALGFKLSNSTELLIERFDQSDLVRAVIVRDGQRQFRMSADEFRRKLGQRLGWSTVLSPTFTIERRGQKFIFRGRGLGSQVGLCEIGAARQAASGRNYQQILSFYYPGAQVGRGQIGNNNR